MTYQLVAGTNGSTLLYIPGQPGIAKVDGVPMLSPLGRGVEISSFSSSLGVGETPSSLDLEIVWNPCAIDGTVYSAYIDPLCIGLAVVFTSNKFVFSGIIKKWSYSQSDAGIKHKISIVDPRELLSMVKVSLSSYYCPVNKPNFMNVLNYIEGKSASACGGSSFPGTILPSVNTSDGGCATWGTAGDGQKGVTYYKALKAISDGTPDSDGKPIYPIMTTTAGTSIYLNFNNLVSLTGPLYTRAKYASTTESNMSLANLIQSACDACGLEYIVSLNGLTANFTYIDRSTEVELGYLESMVNTARVKGTLISSDIGVEEAKEVTGRVVFGDKVHYIKEVATSGNDQKMFMGWIDNNPIVKTVQEFASGGALIDMRPLKITLGSYGVNTTDISDSTTITENEVLALGSLDFWKTYGLKKTSTICYRAGQAIFGTDWTDMSTSLIAALATMLGDNPRFGDISPTLASATYNKTAFLLDDVVYNFLKEWVGLYYGKQWLIPIVGNSKFTCINRVYGSTGGRSDVWAQGDAGATFIADTSVDSAYPDDATILGALNPGTYDTTLFETDDGKIGTIIAFPASSAAARSIDWGGDTGVDYVINFELLDDHYQKNGYIYMKAETVGSEMFNINSSLYALIRTPFIATSPKPSTDLNSNGLIALGLLLGMTKLSEKVSSWKTEAGGKASEINTLKSAPAVGPFIRCAVPMKSNMYCYGPWSNSTGFIGEIEVVDSPDLNPWLYGSVSNMNTIGGLLASAGLKRRNRSETGRVELAEAPGHSLGNLISSGNGPLLSSVVCRFDASGVTTTYEFKTYTQKFGNYAKELAERTKSFVSSRREIYKVVHTNRQRQISLANKTRKDAFKALASRGGGDMEQRSQLISGVGQKGGTLQRLLFSFYPVQSELKVTQGGGTGSNSRKLFSDSGFEKSLTIEHFENKDAYSKYAVCSLDVLFSPISLKGSGGLPQFGTPNGSNAFKNKPRPSIPPIKYGAGQTQAYGLEIKSLNLNPILTKSFLSFFNTGSRSDSTDQGVSIKSIAFGSDPKTLLVVTEAEETAKQNASDYRFSALKGPLVLHSWGYDTNGKPIPNAADSASATEGGVFNSDGLKDRFMTNWTQNAKTWPVGPIDLRWDRDRGVWVSPPAERIVVAQLLTKMSSSGTAKAKVLSVFSQYQNPSGDNIAEGDGVIVLQDFLQRTWKKDARVYASHTGDGVYIILDGCDGDPCDGGCVEGIVRMGSFSGLPWDKESTKDVTFRTPSGGSGSLSGCTIASGVKNIFVSITGTGNTKKNCAITKEDGVWYLIASEC